MFLCEFYARLLTLCTKIYYVVLEQKVLMGRHMICIEKPSRMRYNMHANICLVAQNGM